MNFMISKNDKNESNRIHKYLEEINLQFKEELNISNITEYARKLNENAEIYFLINDAHEDIGMCAIYANDNKNKIIYISSISIKKEYISKGLGQYLLNYVFKLKYDYKMNHIKLEVKKNNQKAISFYRKNGFIITEEKSESYLMED